MSGYFARRLLIAFPVLFGITIIAFLVLSAAPGDPLLARLDPEVRARLTPGQLEARRHDLGLDQPAPIRYARWLGDAVSGNLGYSIISGRPIGDEIARRIGPSLLLMLVAGSLALVLGLSMGIAAATHPSSRLDRGLALLTTGLISTPTFVIAILGLYVFGVHFRLLPVGELSTRGKEQDLIDRLAHLVLPATIVGLVNAAPIARYTRASMLDVLGREFLTTARAKGLPHRVVLVRHALRNALIPVITIVGVLVPELLAGAVVIESIFNWPGLGQLSVRAANDRDPALMMGVVLVFGSVTLVASIVADFAYTVVDPRIRFVRAK